jgi:helix-turn-helix protein
MQTTSASISLDGKYLDELLTEVEAAQVRNQSVRTLQAERLRGGGCPYVKLGRSVRYRRGDLLEFIKSNVRTSTSDEAGL